MKADVPEHQKIMNQIRFEMHNWDPQELADLAGVSKSTIYAIRCGRTAWPRPNTIFPIARVLGYTLVLQKAGSHRRSNVVAMKRA